MLKQAEKQLRSQLHRDDIRSLTRCFGALVRNEMDASRAAKARQERLEHRANIANTEAATHANLRRSRVPDPVAWLREAIAALASQWQPREQQLLFGGVGAALGWMQQALRRIAIIHGYATLTDIANGVMNEYAQVHSYRSWSTRPRRHSNTPVARNLSHRTTKLNSRLSVRAAPRYLLEYRAN